MCEFRPYREIRSIFTQRCFKRVKCGVFLGQMDNELRCNEHNETTLMGERTVNVRHLSLTVAASWLTRGERTLPRHFSLISKWFSSSVTTFDTNDKYSRRLISSERDMFPVYYLAGSGNGLLLIRLVACNKMLTAHVAIYRINNVNTCLCFDSAHIGNKADILSTISCYQKMQNRHLVFV